ncbi:hypothetical protein MVEG_06100 [Podila verticillata NRRL 6337]|nr:hypothetical protein MVEG_06100 [Podila verticillata NRRL 6337]
MKSYRASDFGDAQLVVDGRKNISSAKELFHESHTFDLTLNSDSAPRSNKPPAFYGQDQENGGDHPRGKVALSNNCLTAILTRR